jgi:conjugal transfer/entry exclusion protein
MIDFETYNRISEEVDQYVKQRTNNAQIIETLLKRVMKYIASDERQGGNLSRELLGEVEHIIHFLESLDERELSKQLKGSFEQINSNAKQWSLTLQKQGAKLKDIQEKGLKILMQFKDGFKIVQLNKKEHCRREGNLMGHCVGGYNPKTKTILSLRDSQNQPHVTLEINHENEVHQIKGKSNKAPIPKYQKYIRYFLNKNPQYVIREDGENIGYVRWEGKYYDPDSPEWLTVYENEIKPDQENVLNSIFKEAKNNNGVVKKIHLYALCLTELPQWMADIKVEGDFHCYRNRLTTLHGAPKEVGGDFGCTFNQLITLQGAPQKVGGEFICDNNQLTTLQGAPQKVSGDFHCSNNQLTTLQGAPQKLGRVFHCSHNQLTDLQGAPQEVGGAFYCNDNQLKTLQGAPQEVSGDFVGGRNRLTTLQGAPQKVRGDFYCDENQLTTLKGAPQEVDGAFYCNKNQLTTLQGAPQKVGRSFYCNNNRLTTLQGAPQKVKRDFHCAKNRLATLQGAPKEVGGDFIGDSNRLTTLQGAPKEVRGTFYCSDNRLTTLHGAPQKVGGYFRCSGNTVKFTVGQVRSICEVGGSVYT